MKVNTKRLTAILVLLCMAAALFAGCSGGTKKEEGTTAGTAAASSGSGEATQKFTKPLKIRAVVQMSIAAAAQDNTLEKYVAQRVKEETNVEVEFSSIPPDTTIAQYLAMVNAANNVPEILSIGDLYNYGDAMEYVAKEQMVYEMTEDRIRQNLPNYTSRVEGYGLGMDVVVDETKHLDGKNYYINVNYNPSVFPKLTGTEMEKLKGIANKLYIYNVFFRDDILKKIFPNARTEAEMKALYMQKGELTVEDIVGDIPIKNMEDMYNYLKKVKELNLKVGEKEVIPSALNASSQSVASIFWSLHTAMGQMYRWPVLYNDPIETSYFAQTSSEAHEYIQWLNKMYNDKLMDPEIFVMKDDQYRAKAINGEYAVINCWLPVDQAKQVAKERGYGYRYFPVFYPADRGPLNNQINQVGIRGRSIAFSKTIKEEDLSQVMAWADFFFTRESDEINVWGHPDWYTGEGKDRRYKAEYKELEDWAVYGKNGGKDGIYYGMFSSISGEYGSGERVYVKPFGLFAGDYEEAPYYVYEKDPAQMGDFDIGVVSHNILMAHNAASMRTFLEKGWSERDLANLPEWTEMEKKKEGLDINGLLIKAIIGPSDKFQANWDVYMKGNETAGIDKAVKAVQDKLKEVWESKLLPNEVK